MKSLSTATLRHVLGPLGEGTSSEDSAGLDAEELQQFAQALGQHGRRCVRPRPGLPLDQLPFATEPVPWAPMGRFLLDSSFRPGSSLRFAAGDYAIQDAASLLPITLMQLEPGQHVCDVCAAPGGKSTAILEGLNGRGVLLSNEVIASRVDTLQLALARTGYDNYLIANQSADRLAEVAPEAFDCVLVDAPCSGQSLVARGKQSLSAFSDKQIEHSAARQQSILRSAIQLVRPGGRLVYSTCTFAYAENEAVMAWLGEFLPEWRPVVIDALLPWQSPVREGCYRLWPHRDQCAGGFAAALVRPEDSRLPGSLFDSADAITAATKASGRRPRQASLAGSAAWQRCRTPEILGEFGRFEADEPVWQNRQHLHWFHPEIAAAWRSVARGGIELATLFGDHWHPSHPLATLSLSSAWFTPRCRTVLSAAEAIRYLSGTSLHRPTSSAANFPGAASADAASTAADAIPQVAAGQGWSVATWDGRPLGWGKQVGTQLKNHLPKPLRQPSLIF